MELFTALVVMDQLDVYSAVPVYPISECTVYSSAYNTFCCCPSSSLPIESSHLFLSTCRKLTELTHQVESSVKEVSCLQGRFSNTLADSQREKEEAIKAKDNQLKSEHITSKYNCIHVFETDLCAL